jgi:hypothetical protein
MVFLALGKKIISCLSIFELTIIVLTKGVSESFPFFLSKAALPQE